MKNLGEFSKKLFLCGVIVGGINQSLNVSASTNDSLLNPSSVMNSEEIEFYTTDYTPPKIDIKSISVNQNVVRLNLL